MAPIVIGVDGGGTKTLGALYDGARACLARGSFPSSNPHSNPPEAVAEVLQTLVRSLSREAGVQPAQLDAVCLGMAGCDRDEDRALIERLIRPALDPKTQLVIVNDAVVAMTAVLGRLHGILVIAGTGSICLGYREPSTEPVRCGGWGHILADEGAGYRIGLEALRAILHSVDGRGPSTSMTASILAHLGFEKSTDVISWIYGGEGNKARVAGLSRLVHEADAAGDTVASRILDEQAALLATLVGPVHDQLFRDSGETPDLGLWGGNLVNVERYRTRFLGALARRGIPVRPVVRDDVEAVDGACRHALNTLGLLR